MVKERYIPIIKETADMVRNKNGMKKSAVIGDYIFTILQQECVVMMRPNGQQPDLDGFSTEKVIQGRLETVVYINTAKNVEKQNFCAAHELGHRYRIDRLIYDRFPHDVILPPDIEEIMNRFAAEVKSYLNNLGLSEDNIALAGEMRKLETEMLDLTQQ